MIDELERFGDLIARLWYNQLNRMGTCLCSYHRGLSNEGATPRFYVLDEIYRCLNCAPVQSLLLLSGGRMLHTGARGKLSKAAW